jgi:outer membrane protein assembly factor BamB
VDGQLLYAIGQYGDLLCLETASGAVKWSKNFGKDFKGSSGGWNYTESPLIDGDKLVCTPGGRQATLVALNKLTGEVVWKAPLGDTAGYSSIVVSQAAGVRQYVQLTSDGVIGVAAADGKLLWRYEKLARNTANIPTPVVLGEQIFCSAGYGKGGALLSLKASGDGGVTATEVYYNGALRNRHGGVVIVGDLVFGDTDDSGQPYCADWKTGKVKWKARSKRGQGSASLTYADGHLYVRYSNGWVALVEASEAAYKEISSFKIPNSSSNSWAHPVVADGKLYLREKDTVWCYDVKTK